MTIKYTTPALDVESLTAEDFLDCITIIWGRDAIEEHSVHDPRVLDYPALQAFLKRIIEKGYPASNKKEWENVSVSDLRPPPYPKQATLKENASAFGAGALPPGYYAAAFAQNIYQRQLRTIEWLDKTGQLNVKNDEASKIASGDSDV